MLRFSKIVLSFTAFALLCLAAHDAKAAPVVFTSRTTSKAATPRSAQSAQALIRFSSTARPSPL